MRRFATSILLFLALILTGSQAEAFYVKAGALFETSGLDADTSSSRWIVGLGSDRWFNDYVGLGFEVDFTFENSESDIETSDRNIYFIYPYLNAKVRLPIPGPQFYAGAGVGYSPVIHKLTGEYTNDGGMGWQVLGGISFADVDRMGLFVEAQFKSTAIDTGDRYELLVLYGGLRF